MLGGIDSKGKVATISHLQFFGGDPYKRQSCQTLLSFYQAQGIVYVTGFYYVSRYSLGPSGAYVGWNLTSESKQSFAKFSLHPTCECESFSSGIHANMNS